MGGGGEEIPDPLIPAPNLIRTISRGLGFKPSALTPPSKVGLSCLCPDEPRTGVFGAPPSRMEVETAMAELQRLMRGEARSEQLQWLQPVVYPTDSMIMMNPGYSRVQNAFSMFQKEPTIQNMVVNISSDRAFWDAIMNNKDVQNLQTSISAEHQQPHSGSEKSIDIAADVILKWFLGITKSKIGYFIEKLGMLVAEMFVPGNKKKPTSELTDLVEEKIRSSMLISVVIFMIVVVTRNNGS